MFSIDLDALYQDGLLEDVYVSPPIPINPNEEPKTSIGTTNIDEVLIKLTNYTDISLDPIDWSVCDDEFGRRFAFIRYYLIIVKDGIIPAKYIKLENYSTK